MQIYVSCRKSTMYIIIGGGKIDLRFYLKYLVVKEIIVNFVMVYNIG